MKSISKSYVSVNNGPIEGSITTLTILTAIVHLFLGLQNGFPTTSITILFLLNGIGYLVLLAALYLPPLANVQSLTRWVLIAYTALTVIVWIYITHAEFDPLDYITKLAEIVLIALLLFEAFRDLAPKRV